MVPTLPLLKHAIRYGTLHYFALTLRTHYFGLNPRTGPIGVQTRACSLCLSCCLNALAR
jgi:hypothetical protein